MHHTRPRERACERTIGYCPTAERARRRGSPAPSLRGAGVTSFPWPPGATTGIGSMPGVDPAETAGIVVGELPDLPHLPELPNRGLGADLLGRSAALLVDL